MEEIILKRDRGKIKVGFTELVRQKRQALGISQEELAFRSGLHRAYIGSVERSEKNLSIENIFILTKTLECPPRELIPTIKIVILNHNFISFH